MLQPQNPVPEAINPTIVGCHHQPTVWVVPPTGGLDEYRQVEVTRRENPNRAYLKVRGSKEKPIFHGGAVQWGTIFMAVVLPRDPDEDFYHAPTPGKAKLVMVKRLFRSVVHEKLNEGGMENPYKEIMRMQQLAGSPTNPFVEDAYANDYVLGCIDALQDEKYLYIITPYCRGQSLLSHLPKPSSRGSVEAKARKMFRQMLNAIQYLHDRGICHRDVDPSNFVVRDDGRVLIIDLAMSFLMPDSGLVNHMGRFGKPGYCPPEVWHPGYLFWARQCDLWACAVSLWNLVTGCRLYFFPVVGDIRFKYAIMAAGLSLHPFNEDVERVVNETMEPEETILLNQVALQNVELSPQLRELFHGVLRLNPNHRWNRQQILGCAWMAMNGD